jgi:hypothetical protein
VCLLGVSACGSNHAGRGAAVDLAPPRPGKHAGAACAALSGKLPARLDGHARREVNPASSLTAAWGDPPITLRCGVPRPAALGPAAALTVVNKISWFPEPVGSASPSRFTEVGREAYVEVTLPGRYEPAGAILVAISDAIGAAVQARPGGT